MEAFELNDQEAFVIREILGYLNFSSGNEDPRFADAWNRLFTLLDQRSITPLWSSALELVAHQLEKLAETSDAFKDSKRAQSVLKLASERVFPAYLEFHRDILYHQSPEFLFNPFFIARIFRIILRQPLPWTDEKKVVDAVISEVNNFLGYRPIPILEGEEKHEPNPHEWVAPVPLYQQGAGVAFGRYHDVIEQALAILRDTDSVLLRDAWFDPDKLKELAIDPRAFDFDHPVNRRPNYHFGTWDPNWIDNDGYYRRFIIHQVTLDGILSRVEAGGKPDMFGEAGIPFLPDKGASRDELLFEAGAILAGTMLMGSGVTGDHVQTHDSSVTLGTLMPIIASYRDRFYELLIQKVPDKMKKRLNDEAARLFQPFGGARQDLNKRLAKRRADQLQRFHLARLFARMGYFESAQRQTQIISVTSARMICRIECLLTEGYSLCEKGEYEKGVQVLPEIEDLIHRGIACGALPDPWTLLGFGAQYSLFSSADNTVHDHRIDDLIDILIDVFDLYSRLMKEAAAKGNYDLQADLSDKMSDLAGWWDQYGSENVSSVDGFSGQAIWESATKVAQALAVWFKAGTAAGDVAFWSRHVQRFSSPKAFVLLGEALLDQKDPIASMSLLMYWLSNAETIPLTENDYSFHGITFRWLEDLWEDRPQSGKRISAKKLEAEQKYGLKKENDLKPIEYRRRWSLTETFLARLEANLGIYGEVPTLDVDPELLKKGNRKKSVQAPDDDSEAKEAILEILESFKSFFRFVTQNLKGDLNSDDVMEFMNRPAIRLAPLVDDLPEITEQVRQEPDFQEFIQQEIDPSDFPAFIEFLSKNLVRLCLKQQREADGPEPEDYSNEINLLSLIITRFKEFISKSLHLALNIPEPPKDGDTLYRQYLYSILPLQDWERLCKEVKSPEEDDFSLISEEENWEDLLNHHGKNFSELMMKFPVAELLNEEADEDDAEDDSEDEGDEYGEDDEEDEDENDIGIDPTYRAAYDNMSFRDSAEDGIDDEMMEGAGANPIPLDEDELSQETDRINERLAFIFSLMKLWKYAAGKSPLLVHQNFTDEEREETRQKILDWIRQAKFFQKGLQELLTATNTYPIPKPRGTSESLMEYDQQHGTKEILLDRIIRTSVEVNDAILFLQAVCNITGDNITVAGNGISRSKEAQIPEMPRWFPPVNSVMAALIHSDLPNAKSHWSAMLNRLETETLLYIPTSRGGDPKAIVQCRCLQQAILRLFEYAPRSGLLIETFQLLRTVQKMEQVRPNRPGAITEFDRIVETATRNVIKLLIDSSQSWRSSSYTQNFQSKDEALIFYIERTMDILLACWLSHSQHIRISSVEAIMNTASWDGIKQFIQRYGSDIFTQQFLSFRNLRAVLHQGVENYLRSLIKIYQDDGELEMGELLVSDLAENRYPMGQAVFALETIFECIAENYSEYIDYNSTTTHSDHGEKLYMLLDMFRVLTQYERVSWNLKPVYWVHHTLTQRGRMEAASLWEKSIGKKSVKVADENLKNYKELSSRYGVWLPSIYERLAERFIRPLQVDRMCGFVGEAVRDAQKKDVSKESEAFKQLETMVEFFASTQTGIGFEVPEWLAQLQDEVIRIQEKGSVKEGDENGVNMEDAFNPAPVFDAHLLTCREIERQVTWGRSNLSFQEQ